MKHCTAHGLIKEDPTQGVRLPPVKSDGHHTWSDDEIAAYEGAHPVGTKARLAFALLLYTAQRRRDVIRMGPQHVQNGELRVVQKKTRKPLILPIRPELQAVLDATPTGHLTFLVTKSGKPYPANDFSEQFRVWCNASGLPTACVVHGLRKAACRRMAEAGYSVSEIAAWSGHRTLSEIKRYTDGVDHCQTRANFDSFEGLSLTTRYRKFLRDEPDQVRWVGSRPLSPTEHPPDTPLRLRAQLNVQVSCIQACRAGTSIRLETVEYR